MDEDQLLQEADRRGRTYVAGAETRRVFPSDQDIAALAGFDEALPDQGRAAAETIALMDDLGSPATVASNGPNYFGFVIGASLPVAAAAQQVAAGDPGLAAQQCRGLWHLRHGLWAQLSGCCPGRTIGAAGLGCGE
jgi:hypothetical protein